MALCALEINADCLHLWTAWCHVSNHFKLSLGLRTGTGCKLRLLHYNKMPYMHQPPKTIHIIIRGLTMPAAAERKQKANTWEAVCMSTTTCPRTTITDFYKT